MKTPLIVFYKDINEKGTGKIDRQLNIANEDWHTLAPLKMVLKDTIRFLEIRLEEKPRWQNAREDERQKVIAEVLKIIDGICDDFCTEELNCIPLVTRVSEIRDSVTKMKGGEQE